MTTVHETEFKSTAGFSRNAIKDDLPFSIMVSFEYSVLRYSHDPSTGEVLNFGVVVYCRERGFLSCQIHEGTQRLKCAFPDFDAAQHKQTITRFTNALKKHQERLNQTGDPARLPFFKTEKPKSIQSVLSDIWKDAGLSYQVSFPSVGVSDNLAESLSSLYATFVSTEPGRVQHVRRDDRDLWTSTYRESLLQNNVAHYLTERVVKVEGLELKYDHTFKNGAYHLLEPVSLDYKDKKDIFERVFNLLGQADILYRNKENEDNKLYLLLGKPQIPTLQEAYQAAVRNLRKNLPPDCKIYEEKETDEFGQAIVDVIKHAAISSK